VFIDGEEIGDGDGMRVVGVFIFMEFIAGVIQQIWVVVTRKRVMHF